MKSGRFEYIFGYNVVTQVIAKRIKTNPYGKLDDELSLIAELIIRYLMSEYSGKRILLIPMATSGYYDGRLNLLYLCEMISLNLHKGMQFDFMSIINRSNKASLYQLKKMGEDVSEIDLGLELDSIYSKQVDIIKSYEEVMILDNVIDTGKTGRSALSLFDYIGVKAKVLGICGVEGNISRWNE